MVLLLGDNRVYGCTIRESVMADLDNVCLDIHITALTSYIFFKSYVNIKYCLQIP